MIIQHFSLINTHTHTQLILCGRVKIFEIFFPPVDARVCGFFMKSWNLPSLYFFPSVHLKKIKLEKKKRKLFVFDNIERVRARS